MKEAYESPMIEIVTIEAEAADILTASMDLGDGIYDGSGDFDMEDVDGSAVRIE